MTDVRIGQTPRMETDPTARSVEPGQARTPEHARSQAPEYRDFTTFVADVRPALHRAALLLTGEFHEAEDLVQDTLIAVLGRWDQLLVPSAAPGYARRTMVRTFINDRRHVRWQREILRAPQDLPDRAVVPAAAGDVALASVLADLPPRERAAVVIRYFYDRTVADTAEELGCAPPTVRSQTARALRTMRNRL